jgi:hypothetical protein
MLVIDAKLLNGARPHLCVRLCGRTVIIDLCYSAQAAVLVGLVAK